VGNLDESITKSAPRSHIIKKRSPNAMRLQEVRKVLGMEIKDFADALDVNEYTLLTYLYDRVKVVPKEVMDRAEALNTEGDGAFQLEAAQFEGVPMSEIVERWMSLLKIDHPGDLAELLNTHAFTVRRWCLNQSRPRPGKLVSYQRKIDRQAT